MTLMTSNVGSMHPRVDCRVDMTRDTTRRAFDTFRCEQCPSERATAVFSAYTPARAVGRPVAHARDSCRSAADQYIVYLVPASVRSSLQMLRQSQLFDQSIAYTDTLEYELRLWINSSDFAELQHIDDQPGGLVVRRALVELLEYAA